MRSRIFIAAIRSGGKASSIAMSTESNQASIIAAWPPGKARRARSAGTPSSAAALASAASDQPSNAAWLRDQRRQRDAQLVEVHFVRGDHRSAHWAGAAGFASPRSGRRISTKAAQIRSAPMPSAADKASP